MHSENIYNLIVIDEHSVTPKYLQLVNSIIKGIEDGKMSKGYLLPSINDLSYELEIGRDTSVRAYKELKQMAIIDSVPGKGYFIADINFRQRIKVLLLFNKLSAHKKIIYDSFVAALGTNVVIDFYIYNNDFLLFKNLLNNPKREYTHYVIIPHFLEGGEKAYGIINAIPKEKLVIMDKLMPGVDGKFAAVYENFENDIYTALETALERLQKYTAIKIIFPENSYYPTEIIKGLQKFCQNYAFDFKIIHNIIEEEITAGEVYINVMEDDLFFLLEKINAGALLIGQQIGVISYNETKSKKFILNGGITTISTDFQQMGEIAARLILEKSAEHIAVPFYLTLRNSL
jgi:DNA-binding transcriptional regulator YhcF (GntR family)